MVQQPRPEATLLKAAQHITRAALKEAVRFTAAGGPRPDSTETDGYKTVKAGLDGGVVKDTPEPEEGEPTTFQVHFSISREAIGDHYALRAFNRLIRQKYETVEFTMKPLEEETQHPQDE